MNVFTNDEYLKNEFKQAQRLRWAGLLCLLLVFVVSCPIQLGAQYNSYLLLLAYPFLFIGFPLWTIGSNRLKILKNSPKPNLLLNNELKAFNNRYSLHHFVPFEGGYIKHLLIAPNGLIVFETRDTIGPVSCQSGPSGDRWRDNRGLLDRIVGVRPPIGNPSADLAASMQRARKLLDNIGKTQVPVKGLIVFTRQKDLELESCSYPAVPLDETKTAVKALLAEFTNERDESREVDHVLTSEDRRRLNAQLEPQKPAPPAKPAQAQRKPQ
jgi:hypothetical protein